MVKEKPKIKPAAGLPAEKPQEQGLSRRQNAVQFLKFAAFSVSAGVIELGAFTLLNELTHFPYWPSYLIALVLSVLYNFTFNRQFTFQSAANIPAAMLKVAGYYCVFTPLSTWLGDMCAKAGANEYLVLLVTMALNLSTEFLFCRFVVYRNSINTNERAKKRGNAGSMPDGAQKNRR